MHSLIELYERSVDIEDNCVRVNFHFDFKRADVEVKNVRDDSGAHLTVLNKTGIPVYIRIPSWAPKNSLKLFANDKPLIIEEAAGYVCVSKQDPSTRIELHYALPEYTTEEPWRDESATQDSVTFKWRGDEISEVDVVGRYLEQFPKECLSFPEPN